MRQTLLAAIGACALLITSNRTRAAEIPPELTRPNYRTREITGIGPQADVQRQDPSNVIQVGDSYYVWYTRRKAGVHPYASTVYFAGSKDGVHWTEHGEAIGKGDAAAWDGFGVITPYVAVLDGKYYLFYTGTPAAKPWRSRDPGGTLRHIGIAIADQPHGPWRKYAGNPVLSPDAGAWDSLIVDDAHLIVRGGKCWMYYKGGHGTIRPDQTEWGFGHCRQNHGSVRQVGAQPADRRSHGLRLAASRRRCSTDRQCRPGTPHRPVVAGRPALHPGREDRSCPHRLRTLRSRRVHGHRPGPRHRLGCRSTRRTRQAVAHHSV